MGCGSSISIINNLDSDIVINLNLQEPQELYIKAERKFYLFGENQTHRLVLTGDTRAPSLFYVSKRIRIPRPKVHLDELQFLYEQSQELFSLETFGTSTLPPYNCMLAIYASSTVIFLCGGVDFDGYNVINGSWMYKIMGMGIDKEYESINSNGGFLRTKRPRDCYRRLAKMNHARYSHTGLFFDGSVYVFGGVGEEEETLNICESYKVVFAEPGVWVETTAMPRARSHAACVSYLSKIYLFGGMNGKSLISMIDVFTPASNSWQSIPNLHLPRGISQISILPCENSELLILGGKTSYRINLQRRTYVWDSVVPLTARMKGLRCLDNYYLITDSGKFLVYNITSKTWDRRKKVANEGKLKEGEFSGQLLGFTCAVDNPVLIASEKVSQRTIIHADQLLWFGNANYPLIVCFNAARKSLTKRSVPLSLNLPPSTFSVRMTVTDYFISQSIVSAESQAEINDSSCYIYNTERQEAREASLHQKQGGVAYVDGLVYLIGGVCVGPNQVLRRCSVYSVKEDRWIYPDSCCLTVGRRNCEVLCFTGRYLLIIGGQDQSGQLVRDIEIYDIIKKEVRMAKEKLPSLINLITCYPMPVSDEQKFKVGILSREEGSSVLLFEVSVENCRQERGDNEVHATTTTKEKLMILVEPGEGEFQPVNIVRDQSQIHLMIPHHGVIKAGKFDMHLEANSDTDNRKEEGDFVLIRPRMVQVLPKDQEEEFDTGGEKEKAKEVFGEEKMKEKQQGKVGVETEKQLKAIEEMQKDQIPNNYQAAQQIVEENKQAQQSQQPSLQAEAPARMTTLAKERQDQSSSVQLKTIELQPLKRFEIPERHILLRKEQMLYFLYDNHYMSYDMATQELLNETYTVNELSGLLLVLLESQGH